MKKIITLNDMNHIERLTPYVDGFVFGISNFGARLSIQLTKDECIKLIDQIHFLGKEVFIQVNQLMMDEQLKSFTSFVKELPLLKNHWIYCQ